MRTPLETPKAEAGGREAVFVRDSCLGLKSVFIVMQKLIEVSSLCSVLFCNGLDINKRDDSNWADSPLNQ